MWRKRCEKTPTKQFNSCIASTLQLSKRKSYCRTPHCSISQVRKSVLEAKEKLSRPDLTTWWDASSMSAHQRVAEIHPVIEAIDRQGTSHLEGLNGEFYIFLSLNLFIKWRKNSGCSAKSPPLIMLVNSLHSNSEVTFLSHNHNVCRKSNASASSVDDNSDSKPRGRYFRKDNEIPGHNN